MGRQLLNGIVDRGSHESVLKCRTGFAGCSILPFRCRIMNWCENEFGVFSVRNLAEVVERGEGLKGHGSELREALAEG